MDDDEVIITGRMRMRVNLARDTVRRPARVGNATMMIEVNVEVDFAAKHLILEHLHLARAANDARCAIFVAAIERDAFEETNRT